MAGALHVEITVESRVELANLVHAASDEVCRLVGLDEDSMFNISLALREATVNAMKHGNGLIASRPVVVTFDARRGRLEVQVRDLGNGFDFARHVDPRLPQNLSKTSGRGLFLMKSFMDAVRFSRAPGGGTIVALIKKLPRRGGTRHGIHA